MWWKALEHRAEDVAARLRDLPPFVHPSARVAPTAVLAGEVHVGAGTAICHGAYVEGPVWIGEDCLIGNLAMIRGAAYIGDGVRIGFSTEIKHAVIEEAVAIGPQCFVADSLVEADAYLGAQVRTSNHRLDRKTVKVLVDGRLVDTGQEKLGALIGARASLGIQVIVLPGRTIAPDTLIEPRITVEKNLSTGRYKLVQQTVVLQPGSGGN